MLPVFVESKDHLVGHLEQQHEVALFVGEGHEVALLVLPPAAVSLSRGLELYVQN
jgi:hypothetical protein